MNLTAEEFTKNTHTYTQTNFKRHGVLYILLYKAYTFIELYITAEILDQKEKNKKKKNKKT